MKRLFPSAKNLNTRAQQQRGAAVVEFALVIGILLLIVAGIVEFGRAFWYYDALTKATRDGARSMTISPKATINSVAIAAAQTLVVNAANAANVSPALNPGNVSVSCLDESFVTVACVDGTAPANVRVAITGYSVTIGGWIGSILPSGGDVAFAPHTTMRYMCTGSTGTTCY